MRYNGLGPSGMRVSELCLGCLPFGSQVPEQEAVRIIHTAWDAGIVFFDTADVYSAGRSEIILGKALKDRRHKAIIATKFGLATGDGVNDRGASRKHIFHAVEEGLRRLQTDFIDLLYLHKADPNTRLEETLQALEDLVHQGKVCYLGVCNLDAWRIGKALGLQAGRGWATFQSVQVPYNLVRRQIERDILQLCKAEGLGLVTYNALAGGLLTGKYRWEEEPPPGTLFSKPDYLESEWLDTYKERYWNSAVFHAVEDLKPMAESFNKSLAQLALHWVLQQPWVTSMIIGVTSLRQLETSLGALEVSLTPQDLEACNAVWSKVRGHPADG